MTDEFIPRNNETEQERAARNITDMIEFIMDVCTAEAQGRNVAPSVLISALMGASIATFLNQRVETLSEVEAVKRLVSLFNDYATNLIADGCPVCGHLRILETCNHDPQRT